MAANQTECSRLEQRSVIKFLMAAKCNLCNFIQELVLCTEKHALVKKTVLNMGLPLQA